MMKPWLIASDEVAEMVWAETAASAEGLAVERCGESLEGIPARPLDIVEGYGPPELASIEHRTAWHRAYGMSYDGDSRCPGCDLATMDGAYPLCPDCDLCPDCGHEADCPAGLMLGEQARRFGELSGRVIYLAGPYRGATAEEVQRNTDRIGLLSRLLVKLGAGPVSVHAAVHAGHYGDDADPAARRDGIAAAARIARGIGSIIALERDSGGLSDGTAEEVRVLNNGRGWNRHREPEKGIAVVRWDDLGPVFDAHGFGVAWAALRGVA